MHHSLWPLAVITALSFLTMTPFGLSSMPNNLSAVLARNLLEAWTVTQLEYIEIIQSDNNVVCEQLVLVMFIYRDA